MHNTVVYICCAVTSNSLANESRCQAQQTSPDGDVASREDEVELVVNVDELVECRVSTQPYSSTHHAHSYQLMHILSLLLVVVVVL